MAAIIDVAAQFGGQDAADSVLPHFKAMKIAGRSCRISAFPAPKLTFILRVDGEVSTFGQSGPCHVDIDKNHEYVSIDLVLTVADRRRLGRDPDANAIVASVLGSVPILTKELELADGGSRLQRALMQYCDGYLEAFA